MAEIYSNNRNATYAYAKTDEHLILRESPNSPVFYIDNIDIGKSTGFGYSNGYDFNGKFYDFIYSLNYYIRELIGRIAILYTKLDESVGSYELSTLSYTIPVKESTGYEITTKPIVNNLVPDGVNNLTVNCYNYVSYLDVVSFGTLKNFGYKYDIFYNSNPPNRVDEIKTWINFFKSVHYNLATIKRAIDDLQSKIGNTNNESYVHTIRFKDAMRNNYTIDAHEGSNVINNQVTSDGYDYIIKINENDDDQYGTFNVLLIPNDGYLINTDTITTANYTGDISNGRPSIQTSRGWDYESNAHYESTIGFTMSNVHGDIDVIITTKINNEF